MCVNHIWYTVIINMYRATRNAFYADYTCREKIYIFTVHDYVNEVLESLKTKKFAGQVFLLIGVGEKNKVLQLALSRGQITLYRLKILLR